MGWRRHELSSFGSEIVWLGETQALALYRRTSDYYSSTRYGLNETVFPHVERLNVEEAGLETRWWLTERVGSGNERLFLIFSADEVCEIRALFFLEHWQDLFCPSRDDAVIIPVVGDWALFYCHEDEFEFAK